MYVCVENQMFGPLIGLLRKASAKHTSGSTILNLIRLYDFPSLTLFPRGRMQDLGEEVNFIKEADTFERTIRRPQIKQSEAILHIECTNQTV